MDDWTKLGLLSLTQVLQFLFCLSSFFKIISDVKQKTYLHIKLNKNQENEKEKHVSSSADIFIYIQLYFILILLELGVSRNDPTDFEEACFFAGCLRNPYL